MNLPILGEVVYWRMEGVRVDLETAVKKAKELNLPVSVSGLTEVAAMRKALDRIAKSESEDIIWRSDSRESAYYVAKVEIVNGIKTESSVAVRKVKQETGDVVFDYSGDGNLCVRIRSEYEWWNGKVDAGRMIECLVSFIEGPLSGVRLRKGGGVYFVKKDFGSMLDKLERWLVDIGANVILSRIKLIDETRTIDEVALLFIEKMKEDLGEVKEYLSKVLNEDLRKNSSGINARLERLNKMKQDLQLYNEVLGKVQKEELEKQLEEVKASLFVLTLEK